MQVSDEIPINCYLYVRIVHILTLVHVHYDPLANM